MVLAINETRVVVQATIETVTGTLGTAVERGVALDDVIDDVARGAIRGALQARGDLTQAATGLMLGVLRGLKDAGPNILHLVSSTSETAILETSAAGGDLDAVATGLVVGAMEGAMNIGLSRAEAAAVAADGALKAAHLLGWRALETVQHAVTQPMNGITVLMKKPDLVLAE
jgi:hypothetical protein